MYINLNLWSLKGFATLIRNLSKNGYKPCERCPTILTCFLIETHCRRRSKSLNVFLEAENRKGGRSPETRVRGRK